MRQLHGMLYAMDSTQKIQPEVGDINEIENEDVKEE
jgi:hypothetical protein